MDQYRGAVATKLALSAVIVIGIVAAGSGYLLLVGRQTNSSTTTGPLSSVPVQTEVNQFVQDLNDRSVDGLSSFYATDSVVHWSGQLGGLQGRYTGPDDIRLLYASSVGKTTTIDANSSNYAEHDFSPTQVNATFGLVIRANSTIAGELNSTIKVSQQWNWSNGGWHISKENWAYSVFSSSLLNSKYGSVTTFPQWGYGLKGGNPDLVSEKSFEWHAGPYLAAAVYAFLAGVLAVGVVKVAGKVET